MDEEHVITVDGRRLAYERHGEGRPLVVCEAGMGVSRNTWGAVIPLVAARTTIVAYDRGGLGHSDPDPATRDLHRLADDLLALLDHLGDGPAVLVGHSWGGPVVRTAAARAPGRVAGLVLVDPTDEGCDLFFGKGMARQDRVTPFTMTAMSRTGLLRRMARKQAAQLPEPWASAMAEQDGTPPAVAAQLAEWRTYSADLVALRADPPVLPDVPVTIVSGGNAGFMERSRRGPLVEAHRRSAARAAQGRHVVAGRSSHLVPFTEPDLVAAEVLGVVDAVRS